MPDWTWAAASRRGSSHADLGERRQDAFRVAAPLGNGIISIAACDGAGSASHGGEGASLVAWTLIECARHWCVENVDLPDDNRVEQWFQLARLRIFAAAASHGMQAHDFATTAVLALSNGTSTLTAHVGDGAVVARCGEASEWLALSWPQNGEYASTTFFLTDNDVQLRIGRHSQVIDRVVVTTDGLERLALDMTGGTAHTPFFEALSNPLAARGVAGRCDLLSRQLGRFLDSPEVLARTDDDKTLIMAALV